MEKMQVISTDLYPSQYLEFPHPLNIAIPRVTNRQEGHSLPEPEADYELDVL
jgi:hypothetical protein